MLKLSSRCILFQVTVQNIADLTVAHNFRIYQIPGGNLH